MTLSSINREHLCCISSSPQCRSSQISFWNLDQRPRQASKNYAQRSREINWFFRGWGNPNNEFQQQDGLKCFFFNFIV